MKVNCAQSCPTLCDPMEYTVHGILQARILEWVAFHFSRGSSQLRDWPQVSHIAGGFFTSWETREAPNTGVSSLSLLHQIFLTQGSNQGLLHCRWILYQLSYQGSPWRAIWFTQPANVRRNPIQNDPHRNTWNNLWPNGPVESIHNNEMNHHRL